MIYIYDKSNIHIFSAEWVHLVRVYVRPVHRSMTLSAVGQMLRTKVGILLHQQMLCTKVVIMSHQQMLCTSSVTYRCKVNM